MDGSAPVIAITEAEPWGLPNAVEFVRALYGPVRFWGAEIDLRHPSLPQGEWFARTLDVSPGAGAGVAVVNWGSGADLSAVFLAPGDRLAVAAVDLQSEAVATDAPADQDHAYLTLQVTRRDGTVEPLGPPLRARSSLCTPWSWGTQRMGELLWLSKRLDDVSNRPPPKKGQALAAYAVALDEARQAVAKAEAELDKVSAAQRSLDQWRNSEEDYRWMHEAGWELLHSPQSAISAAARAGYAVARVEVLAGAPRSVTIKARKNGKARHRTTDEGKAELRRIWGEGEYSSRNICADEEGAALGLKPGTARRALIGTPEPKRKP